MDYVLQTNNLTKQYRDFKAVDNLQMQIKRGDLWPCRQKRRRQDDADPPALRTAESHQWHLYPLWPGKHFTWNHRSS